MGKYQAYLEHMPMIKLVKTQLVNLFIYFLKSHYNFEHVREEIIRCILTLFSHKSILVKVKTNSCWIVTTKFDPTFLLVRYDLFMSLISALSLVTGKAPNAY